jgi:hypothetical protein
MNRNVLKLVEGVEIFQACIRLSDFCIRIFIVSGISRYLFPYM